MMIEWTCPKCGTTVHIPNQRALRLVRRAGMCQGCRATETFRKNPGALGLFLDFWARTNGWPESDSWMGAIRQDQAVLFGFVSNRVLMAA